LGGRKGTQPVKTEGWCAGVDICLKRGADLHMAQLTPLSLVGFIFLVPVHPGSPGQRAIKRVCVISSNVGNGSSKFQQTSVAVVFCF